MNRRIKKKIKKRLNFRHYKTYKRFKHSIYQCSIMNNKCSRNNRIYIGEFMANKYMQAITKALENFPRVTAYHGLSVDVSEYHPMIKLDENSPTSHFVEAYDKRQQLIEQNNRSTVYTNRKAVVDELLGKEQDNE